MYIFLHVNNIQGRCFCLLLSVNTCLLLYILPYEALKKWNYIAMHTHKFSDLKQLTKQGHILHLISFVKQTVIKIMSR